MTTFDIIQSNLMQGQPQDKPDTSRRLSSRVGQRYSTVRRTKLIPEIALPFPAEALARSRISQARLPRFTTAALIVDSHSERAYIDAIHELRLNAKSVQQIQSKTTRRDDMHGKGLSDLDPA